MRFCAAAIFCSLLSFQAAVAECLFIPGEVIKGRVLRCEKASSYVEAAIETWEVQPENPEQLLEAPYVKTAAVLVILVEWRLGLTTSNTRDEQGQIKEEVHPNSVWKKAYGYRRVWFHEQPKDCAAISESGPVEFRVHPPCCDVFPAVGACLALLDRGELVTKEIKEWYAGVPSPD